MQSASFLSLLLVSALSLDSLAAGLSYGTQRIRIRFACAVFIHFICSVVLGLSFLLGNAAGSYIPSSVTSGLRFIILFTLGITKLLNSTIKAWLGKQKNSDSSCMEFQLFHFRFLLQIICDSTQADADRSKTLSAKEAMALAFALSVDGLSAGLGIGLSPIDGWEFIMYSFFFGTLAMLLGSMVGNHFSSQHESGLSWIGGILLIGLAFLGL